MKSFFLNLMKFLPPIFLFFFLSFSPVKALTISPPFFDESLNPGDTVLGIIKIYNESPIPLTIYPFLQNVTSDKNEGGEPRFYSKDDDKDGTSLINWISINSNSIEIKPQQRANFQFSINIPKNAQPGGHYGAILLGTSPPTKGGEIALAGQIASLIFVKVSGEVKEIGNITEFGFIKKQVWYNYLPIDFFLRFENTGNTHLRPVGNLFIKNWFGKQVASLEFNKDFRSILPKSIRRFEFGWHKQGISGEMSEFEKEWKNFAIGKYTATIFLNYGSQNYVLSDERVFYVWPWRLMIVFGISLIFLIILLVFAVKAHNRAIIRRFERMGKK